ncbi:hypothetical protein [Chitinilyticum piscinae]|uniref:Uncharacterized protein n=1 Tax=Chitinilyticum piscinae TaxID=2866724 RepID=A0A8J7K1A1_9NEIS|nr:hypothetical protein [Chitinilyticum piscinae]MBE9608377.1 hypothetical protein [Chitinilyticum piscinae]
MPNSTSTRGQVSILSRVDFLRMASRELPQAFLFLMYDHADERTTKGRSQLIDYLSDIGMVTESQAIEAHKSIIMYERPADAVRAWQQINDHSGALAAHVFWHGMQDEALHHDLQQSRPKEVSPLVHH